MGNYIVTTADGGVYDAQRDRERIERIMQFRDWPVGSLAGAQSVGVLLAAVGLTPRPAWPVLVRGAPVPPPAPPETG